VCFVHKLVAGAALWIPHFAVDSNQGFLSERNPMLKAFAAVGACFLLLTCWLAVAAPLNTINPYSSSHRRLNTGTSARFLPITLSCRRSRGTVWRSVILRSRFSYDPYRPFFLLSVDSQF
jgi:hypothetical protein